MAAFENMYDIAFKPQLLHSLIRERLPDEKHPFKGPLDVSDIVSMVKTHRLLSESGTANLNDSKLLESWKAAIDVWVNRILVLTSSNMPDKCLAGICLLGVTCQECNSVRFVASYSEWLQKLQLQIQPPTDSHFVKLAAFASLSHLFSRLGRLPSVKKDATSQAAKFVQPVLKLLNEDSSEAVWEGAVCLLCTLITFFPSSIHRCYDSVEAAVVSKIMSGNCRVKMLKGFGHCLALLPKSRGDEESWTLMMHKILYAINVYLDDAFQGVEEESKSNEALRLLVPPGKDLPLPLGTIGDASDQKPKKPKRLHISSVSALMHCCSIMLTSSYPVQVRVPIRSLVALVGRVLMVDGSLSQALFPFMSAMQQELICSELPILHLHSLELLRAVIKGVRSQLLPHTSEIVRLLTEYFKRCSLPDLRIEVYSIVRMLLTSMGVGVAVYLAQEVMNTAFVDLDFNAYVGVGKSSSAYSRVSSEALQPFQKKRKHAKTSGSLEEQPDKVDLEEVVPGCTTPLQLKIAALKALEAVLTVGGALGAKNSGPSVDHLLITVATNACKGRWAKEEHVSTLNEPVPTSADFQLAAFEALLASLLSSACSRPPYLAQGLELFHRGMQETGTKLAEFCAHALLVLEVRIHPRALPLNDYSSPSTTSFNGVNKFPDVYSYGVKQNNTPFSSGSLGKGPENSDLVEDDLYKSWLAENEDREIQVPDARKSNNYTEKSPETVRDPSPEKIYAISDSFIIRIPEDSREELASVCNAADIEGNGDENMGEAQQFEEPIKGKKMPAPVKGMIGSTELITGVISDNVATDPVEGEKITSKVVLETRGEVFGTSPSTNASISVMERSLNLPREMITSKVVLETKRDVFGTTPSTNASISVMERSLNLPIEVDSDMESLPDIVDGDPDSD